jgi:Nuclease-related domain/UvrD-like helicase C-terminal domain/AAA domain
MTKIIPLGHKLVAMTSGEKRLAERLESKLEDDYLVWFDVAVGNNHQHPDFIILHPLRGILVLEVKDWKPTTIQSFNPNGFQLLTNQGLVNTKNPIEQARSYAMAIDRVLRQDTSLIAPHGDRYQGKLIFPYGYGVVFTNIKRAFFTKNQIGLAIPEHIVICQEEMNEEAGKFQEYLWQMWPRQLNKPLTNEQIDRIRALIFPEIVMPSRQLSIFLKEHPLERVDFQQVEQEPKVLSKPILAVKIPTDLMKVMDLKQEMLSRDLGDGHRVIHGVAGSGKTMILMYRCQYLAKQKPKKPILVLCFNVVLAAKLQESIRQQENCESIQIFSFHSWLIEQCYQHRINKPNRQDYEYVGDYLKDVENLVVDGIESGKIPIEQYSSVLIDEGHDLEAGWLKLIAQMPENKSLLLLYDDAQNLYLQEQKKKKFTFKSVGIEAQGRSKKLNINYRNTSEVLGLAYRFAKDVMESNNNGDEDFPVLIKPETAGRHGEIPQLVSNQSWNSEVKNLIQIVTEANLKGVPWSEIAILYRDKMVAKDVEASFIDQGIPLRWLTKNSESRRYDPRENSIKLVTMHSSKGLEFPLVIMPGLGFPGKLPAAEAMRLLYVGMTRSTNKLIMLYHRENNLVRKLQTALEKE